MKKYSTKLLENVDLRFEREWKALWKKAENANLFNSPDWFSMASGRTKFKIFAVYQNGELVAVMPLSPTKAFGISVLSPLNHEFTINTPFLLKEVSLKLIKCLFQFASKEGNLYINKIDLEEAVILKKAFPEGVFPLISVNPHIDLAGGDPFRYISSKNKHEIRRVLRKHGDSVQIKIIAEKEEISRFMPTMFEIDRKSAKEKRAMSIFTKEENIEVFKRFADKLSKFIEIAVLSYDNIPVAYIFCFKSREAYILYQASYLFEARKISPGKIIVMKLLESIATRKYKLFDFSGGVSAYKQDFTTEYYIQYNFYLSSKISIRLWWSVINKARRLKQILFPQKYTRDHEFLFKTL